MSTFLDVLEFHRVMGLTLGDFENPALGIDERMRLALIEEELDELKMALAKGDLVEAADALADLAYVVAGAAVTWGIPLDDVHDEVHRSNLTKVGGERRADGKLLKPPGYKRPEIARVMHDAVEDMTGRLLNRKAGR
jgi:predicted HAD superfamily Cof-like phosphohydrolase